MTNNHFAVDPAAPSSGTVLLLTTHPVLGPALEIALTTLGWAVTRQPGWTEPADRARSGQHLLLVTDGAGALPTSPAYGRPANTTCVAVGARTEIATLTRAMAEGARAVVSADRPFTELVGRLHELLSEPVSFEYTTRNFDDLEARATVAGRFRLLTGRQRQILVALLRGHTAAQIAGREHLSMATVRSHLKSILGTLETSSQLTAAALAHWACDDPAVLAALTEIHHF